MRARAAFERRAGEHAARFVRIDAGQSLGAVAEQLDALLRERGL